MAESKQASTNGIDDRLRTGLSLHHGFEHSVAWLKANSEAVDRLNVFPVPDGDTGTNMLLTMQAALKEIQVRQVEKAGEVAAAAAGPALGPARGASS